MTWFEDSLTLLAPIAKAAARSSCARSGEESMKHIDPRMAGSLALMVSLGACVTPPVAPTIPVAPGPNKTFEAFSAEQSFCQQYASAQTVPQAQAANNQAVGTALLTAALGAGLGAAVGGGGWHGNAGRGAGIGAASGAVVGTALGASQAGFAQMSLQQQFDIMYGQCMYSYGNHVPGFSPPPGTPPYSGAPGPASYRQPSYPGGPGPSPYGSSPYPGGLGPSPYGSSPYPGEPGPAPYGPPPYGPPSY
jgi:outer membrane lipoprotein SlyB